MTSNIDDSNYRGFKLYVCRSIQLIYNRCIYIYIYMYTYICVLVTASSEI